MYLLDTNVISELRKGYKADPVVAEWAKRNRTFETYLSVVSIMEIQIGIFTVKRRDEMQANILQTWLSQQLLPTFSGKILDITLPIALHCARLHTPNPCSERDALIAATALVYGMTVVTRNVKDFNNTGVLLVNPWQI